MARSGTELYDTVAPRGIVVEPDDARAFAQAIVNLADDPARRARLGAEARRFACETLSTASVLARLEARLIECARRATPAIESRRAG